MKSGKLITWLLTTLILSAGQYAAYSQGKPETLLQKAEDFQKLKQADSAAYYYGLAGRLLIHQQDWQQAIRASRKQADIYFGNRRSEEAIQTFRFMLDSLSRQLNDSLRGEAFYKIGISYARMARFVPALENVKQARQIRSRVYEADNLTLATTYHMLGRLYFVIGDYRQSLLYQQRFMEVLQANYEKDHPRMAEAYLYVGLSFSRLYEHDLALEFYQKTLDILLQEDQPNYEGIASTYNNMGLVYGRMGRIERELEYLEKAMALRESENSAKATNLHNIGRAHVDLGNYDKGLDYLQRAAQLKIKLVGNNHTTLATTYGQLAYLYQELQMYDSALHYQQQALAIDQSNYGSSGVDLSDDYAELARTHALLAQTDTALHYIQKAIGAIVQGYDTEKPEQQPRADQLVLDKRTLSSLLHEKSRLLFLAYEESEETEQLQLAYQCSNAAVDFSEQVFAELHDQESVTFLAENANAVYEQLLKTALQLHQESAASELLQRSFAVMERNKARLLLQNIARSRWKNATAVDDSLLNEESELRSQMAYFEKLRFEESARADTDSLQLAEIQNQLFDIRRKLQATEAAILAQAPQKNTVLYQARYASLEEVQQMLAPDELLLEYFEGEESIYGMAIGRSGVEMFRLGDSPDFRTAIHALSKGLREKDYASYSAHAHQLFQQAVGKFQAMAQGDISQLIIIPDGHLGYIPFEALLSEAPPGEAAYHRLSYLIKDYTLAYQYSASLLLQQETKPTDIPSFETSFLGYAPAFDRQRNPLLATRSAADEQIVSELQDLPYAREEVVGIATILDGQAYTAGEATESRFKQSAAQGRILHLASHTLINDVEPLYSRLVFSPDDTSEEDGLLHTYELYGMNIPAEMVTLSACNTGLGKIKAGEGIISLARGFMYAGVSNVLMSLWAVSDRSTAQLMQYFYQALTEGDAKAEALREAKLRYLQQADANTAAPYYWSGFVLISSEQASDASAPAWLYFALILGAFIFASGLLIKKKYY